MTTNNANAFSKWKNVVDMREAVNVIHKEEILSLYHNNEALKGQCDIHTCSQ